MGLLGLLVGDRQLTEDLAQETFVRACRDWHKICDHTRPGAWLHRVAVNLAMSSHRRRRAEQGMLRRLHVRDRDGLHDPDTSVAVTVRHALRQLPMKLRAVIVLRLYPDCSVPETAAVLGVPEGTVKTRTRRALAELRDGSLIETIEVTDAL